MFRPALARKENIMTNPWYRRLVAIGCSLLLIGFGTVSSQDDAAYDAWLEQAQLGPYQPAEEDWDAILEAAREEPPLTFYVATSRALGATDRFNERYGLNVEAINLGTNDLIERVRREWDAGLRNAGLIMVGNPALFQEALLSRNAVTRYVPRELEAVMDPIETEPLLRHRYSVGTWYYSTDGDPDVVPYENLWELTTEPWRNRVATTDPLSSSTILMYFTAVVSNADQMAQMYEDYFGESIELTTENAGYEFIKRLLDNDVRIVSAQRDVAEAVSVATGNFAGMGTQSLYRLVQEGTYDFTLDTTVNPVVRTFQWIGIGSYTESPNQAKLLLDWLMSQEGGAPWWAADFAVNPLVDPTDGFDLRMADFAQVWEPTVDEMVELSDDLIDFFLLYR